jgi:hypothetical protein
VCVPVCSWVCDVCLKLRCSIEEMPHLSMTKGLLMDGAMEVGVILADWKI